MPGALPRATVFYNEGDKEEIQKSSNAQPTTTAMQLCEGKGVGLWFAESEEMDKVCLGRGLAFRHESVLCPALEQMLGPSRPQHL